MRKMAALLAATMILAACTETEVEQPEIDVNRELVEAAYDICPMLWQWQLSIGAVMNDMSRAAREETRAETRLEIYLTAMETARGQMAALEDRVLALNTRYTAVIGFDIETGLADGEGEIDEVEQFVRDSHSAGEPSYHEMVPPIFHTFEKVIDLAKPEMASYDDPAIVPSFREIPQCQLGVKDVDDGVPRHIPLEPDPSILQAVSG